GTHAVHSRRNRLRAGYRRSQDRRQGHQHHALAGARHRTRHALQAPAGACRAGPGTRSLRGPHHPLRRSGTGGHARSGRLRRARKRAGDRLTMDQATPVVDHYIAEFARMENTLPGAVAIMEQRKQALQAFTSHGFPTIREEDWKYTKLRKLQKSVFELSDTPGTVTAQTLSKHLPDDLDAHRAVVVDGYYRADLSQLDGLPEGVHVRSFAEYLETDAEASIRHPLITDQPGSPSDMNAAFVTDGVLITVDAGV